MSREGLYKAFVRGRQPELRNHQQGRARAGIADSFRGCRLQLIVAGGAEFDTEVRGGRRVAVMRETALCNEARILEVHGS